MQVCPSRPSPLRSSKRWAFRLLAPATLAALGSVALAPAAHAQVAVSIFQSGANVDAQATGTLNLAGLSFASTDNVPDFVYGQFAGVLVGNNSTNYDIYSGITGPAAFGSGGEIFASSGAGDRFAIVGGYSELAVPTGYTSGSAINGSAVFANQTLSSLGLTPGTYTYTLPDDTVTVHIGAAPVPEASTTASLGLMLALGLGGLAVARRKRAA